MTKEDATEIWLPIIKMEFKYMPECYEALEMAITALAQEPCTDAISRQIISDYVESHIQEINTGYGDLNKHTNEILRMIVDYIESMPPVKPQYTEAEIQKMQDLESVEIQTAYEIGKAEGSEVLATFENWGGTQHEI